MRNPFKQPELFVQPRSGYSLLEVLLALALSVAVFAAIAMGIQTHLAGLTRQKVMIERKQIARSILAMMANDLRAGIQYKAADYSGLENLVKSQQLQMASALGALTAAAGGGAAPATGGGAPAGGAASTGGAPQTGGSTGTGGGSGASGGASSAATTPTTTEDEESVIDEDEVSFRPALIGTSTVVILDISRLPRLDQYNPLIASAETLAQSPSDVKSIAYFYSDSDGGRERQIQFDNTAPGGLYRREIDRAVAAYMGDIGLVSEPDQYSHLLASEIAEIGFRYFDGSDWQTTWNSEDSDGFPSAIEITVVIDPARSSTNNLTYSYGGFDRSTMESFRSVVHLPVAEIIEEESE